MSLKKGDRVRLKTIPADLLKGLDPKDQEAIRKADEMQVNEIRPEDGKAELEFEDASGITHAIWVDPECIAALMRK